MTNEAGLLGTPDDPGYQKEERIVTDHKEAATTYGNDFDPYEGGKSYVDKAIDMGKELAEKDATIARLTALLEEAKTADVYYIGFEDGEKYSTSRSAASGKLIDTPKCPRCGGLADNGFDNWCTQCESDCAEDLLTPEIDTLKCTDCNGTGYCRDDGPRPYTCGMCGGTGYERIPDDAWTIPSGIPTGYRLCIEQMAHQLPFSGRAWMARLITGVQGKDCIKGYGPTPRAAVLMAIAKTKGEDQ